jgi:hypothetical protein
MPLGWTKAEEAKYRLRQADRDQQLADRIKRI